MENTNIIDLHLVPWEQAISEPEGKYHPDCYRIAYSILTNREETRGCVRDLDLGAGKAAPAQGPALFSGLLGRIIRNLSFDCWRRGRADMGAGGKQPLAVQEQRQTIEGFLQSLSPQERDVFVYRYWYLDSTEEIARRTGCSAGRIKSMLHRVRSKLRRYLLQEGLP